MTELIPATLLADADRALAGGALPLAGGTDLLVQYRAGRAVGAMVDLTNLVDAPAAVSRTPDGLVTLSALAPIAVIARQLGGALPGIRAAIGVFASPQIRNRATIGGNLATASPAGDLHPALAVAEAQVQLRGAAGRRSLPLEEFLLGPRRTALRPGEWIESVRLREPAGADGFRKIGGRRSLAISLVSLAWRWRIDPAGRLADVRIAAGAASPAAVRCRRCEHALEGAAASVKSISAAARALAGDIAPIDDVRAGAGYRRRAATGLLIEALLPHLPVQDVSTLQKAWPGISTGLARPAGTTDLTATTAPTGTVTDHGESSR